MAITEEQTGSQIAKFINTDNQDTLAMLKRLGAIRRQMNQVENAGLEETTLGELRPAKDFQPQINAVLAKRRKAAEAMDATVDKWIADQQEQARADVAGGLPTDATEKLLYQQMISNLRADYEPLFAGPQPNGMQVVAKFGRAKRFEDSLAVRAALEVIHSLDQLYPKVLAMPGVDRDVIFTGDVAARVSDETRAAETVFALLAGSRDAWQAQRRKRTATQTHATGLLNLRELEEDLPELFLDAGRSPLEQMQAKVPATLLIHAHT